MPPRVLPAAIAALCLAGCAGDIPYANLEAKYASPASRYMELPGGLRVHYRDQGPRDAPAVVLVHGFAASLHAWEPWVARLPDYRLVTLDLPGHGLTRAPADFAPSGVRNVEVVDQVTSRLGLQRFVLGGNSMGGAVAWTYAVKHPDKLNGLVLVDAAGWPNAGERQGQPMVFKLLANPAGRALLRNIDPGMMAKRGLQQAYLDETLVTDALVARYVELARAPGHRAILTGGGRERGGVTPETFRAISVPTLVMTGEKDSLIPAANSRAMAAAIPDARLVTYPDGGHVPMEQLPERSATDLRAFLAALPPPACALTLAMGETSGFLEREDGERLAWRKVDGRGPAVVWLGGFKSDMSGTKAQALADWAGASGRAYVRFDYFGHGESSGAFEHGTITQWREDALAVLEALTEGETVLVGSSMGGWIACLAAMAVPERVKAMVLIAPAADFTEKLMRPEIPPQGLADLARDGVWLRPSEYGAPYPISRALLEDGARWGILEAQVIPIEVPVRILQGGEDPDVPWSHALQLANGLKSHDVVFTLIKDGDHRLSRPQDLARLLAAVNEVS